MRFTVCLPPATRSIGIARHALDRLSCELDEATLRNARLLVSELVTNAVRHARMAPDERIVLAARLEPDFARIEIRDTGRGFDPDVRAEARGYGLRLTDMLATRWGVDRDETAGTRVWFEVDRRRRRFSRSA